MQMYVWSKQVLFKLQNMQTSNKQLISPTYCDVVYIYMQRERERYSYVTCNNTGYIT